MQAVLASPLYKSTWIGIVSIYCYNKRINTDIVLKPASEWILWQKPQGTSASQNYKCNPNVNNTVNKRSDTDVNSSLK